MSQVPSKFDINTVTFKMQIGLIHLLLIKSGNNIFPVCLSCITAAVFQSLAALLLKTMVNL